MLRYRLRRIVSTAVDLIEIIAGEQVMRSHRRRMNGLLGKLQLSLGTAFKVGIALDRHCPALFSFAARRDNVDQMACVPPQTRHVRALTDAMGRSRD